MFFHKQMHTHRNKLLAAASIGALVGTGYYLFERYKESNSIKKLKPTKIVTEPYLYHAVGGFNVYKLYTILEKGILSVNASEQFDMNIVSFQAIRNFDPYENNEYKEYSLNTVSLATNKVLSDKIYAAVELSLIIEPKGLTLTRPWDCNFIDLRMKWTIPHYEIRAKWMVPSENIMGVMIPEDYLSTDLIEIPVFNRERFQTWYIQPNMINLDNFLKKEFSASLLSDPEIVNFYNIAMKYAWQDIGYHTQEKEAARVNLNRSIMRFIKDTYKKELVIEPSLVDIIHYHTKGKYPIYNTKGELITPKTDNDLQKAEPISLSLSNSM